MISAVPYNASKASEWDLFVRGSRNGTFLFERAYMEYHADRFEDASLLFYDSDKDELLALLPASRHGTELRSHGGLTYGGIIVGQSMTQAKMNDCVDSLIRWCHANGITSLQYKPVPHIYHRSPTEEDLFALWRYGAVLVQRNVATCADLAMPVPFQKCRIAHIKRAIREAVTISSSEDFESFITLQNEVLRKYHGATAVHSAEELTRLHRAFPEQIQLWTARSAEGELIAGTVLFLSGNVIHTQYLAANDKARRIGGLDYLIKTLMDTFTGKARYFDFGTSMERDGRLNGGLCFQKEGFGGRTVLYDYYGLDIDAAYRRLSDLERTSERLNG